MFEPMRINADAIPAALEKATRYRLLNEPLEAESICRDVLAIDPDSQQALVTMLLALTDQFQTESSSAAVVQARSLLPQLSCQYEREYYAGIIDERWAKAQLTHDAPGEALYGWIHDALRCYERAIALSEPDDPDAILRWNACVRLLERNPHIRLREHSLSHDVEAEFGDDVPLR